MVVTLLSLIRIAWLELNPATSYGDGREFVWEDVVVRLGLQQPNEKVTRRLFAAEVSLCNRPSSSDGWISVPDGERLKAEQAIETVADALSVMSGSRRSLFSPAGLAVAFRSDDADALAWLQSHRGIAGASEGVARARFMPRISDVDLRLFDDREDGLALLAEALAQPHDAGRFRELQRIFERAFAASGKALVTQVAKFLGARPAIGFDEAEVKNWLVLLRGRAVHADRETAFLREREVTWVVDRMLLAAYEILLNKKHWRRLDSERRDAWTPQFGPLDRHGRGDFAVVGSQMTAGVNLMDQFHAFPTSDSDPGFTLPTDYWPRSRVNMEWPQTLQCSVEKTSSRRQAHECALARDGGRSYRSSSALNGALDAL